MNAPLLEVENLHRQFVARRSALGRPTAVVTAVEAVSFALQAGTTRRWSVNPDAAKPRSDGWCFGLSTRHQDASVLMVGM